MLSTASVAWWVNTVAAVMAAAASATGEPSGMDDGEEAASLSCG